MIATSEPTLARNAGWMFLGQGFSLLIQAPYFVLLARLLGSHDYGVFIGAAALVSIFSQYSSLGSGMVLLRHFSQKSYPVDELWGNVIVTTCGTGFLLAFLITIFGGWLIGASSAAILGFIAFGECICAKLAEAGAQAFQAFACLKMTALLGAATNLLRLAAVTGMIIILHHGNARTWAQACLGVSCVSALIATTLVTVRITRPRFRLSLLLKTASEGLGFSVASSTTSVYNDLDKTMLNHYGMVSANGSYAIGYKLIDLTCVPIRAIHAAAFPHFCQRGIQGAKGSVLFAKRILQATLPYSLLCGILLFLCSPIVVVMLGDTFRSSASTVRWLSLLPAFRSLHLSAGDTLTGAGYQRYRTGAQLAAAAFNFLLNLCMIPALSWRGAALSSLITDGLLAIANWTILCVLVQREQSNRRIEPCGELSHAPSI